MKAPTEGSCLGTEGVRGSPGWLRDLRRDLYRRGVSTRYPAEYEGDVELSDGSTAFVRPVKPDDGPDFVTFHGRQSAESIYYRYFSPHPTLSDAEVEYFVTVDYHDRFALVAFRDDVLIGVARYDRPEASQAAEVAFFIDDEHHGLGLATILLEHLAEAARDRGIDGFWATVLPDNRRMVGVFRQAGFGVTSRFSDGVIEVELTLEPTDEARIAIEQRARRAQQEAVRRILSPNHIVIIGAKASHRGAGRRILDSVLDHGYTGTVSIVHPDADTVSGVDTHRSVLDIDDEIDLAIVAVPASSVIEVVDECGRAGVAATLVISAGFSDAGSQGAALEGQLLTVVRRYGMRLLGPNSLGLINTDPDVRLFATFVPARADQGGVAIMSQSGAVGGAIIEQAARAGLGVSSFVSVGNKADVSGNDLLTFWGDDPRTKVVLMYLESFGNPRRFGRIARSVSLSTPVLAIKAGRRRRDPDSGLDDATVDALLARQGVVRVDGVARLLDVARVLSCQGFPRGERLALVSNSGGALRLAADAAVGAGLDVTVEHDLGWDATVDDYRACLASVFGADDADQVLVMFSPTDLLNATPVLEAMHELASAHPATPVLASVFGPHDPMIRPESDAPIPIFDFPDDAVIAAGHAATYGRWRATAESSVVESDLDAPELRAAASVLAMHGPRSLDLEQASALLARCGLEVTDFRLVSSASAAVGAADEIGYPVVLKAGNVDGPARREAEGASLDLHRPEEVEAAFERMEELFGDQMRRAVVQQMNEVATDLVVGVTVETGLGPIVWTRTASGETRRSMLPLTEQRADHLVPDHLDESDRSAVRQLLIGIASLADAVPEVRLVRLAPVMAGGGRAAITNVRIEVAPDRRPDLPEVRRLESTPS